MLLLSLNNQYTTLEDFKNIKEIIINKYPNFKSENIKSIFVKILPDADVISPNKSFGSQWKNNSYSMYWRFYEIFLFYSW